MNYAVIFAGGVGKRMDGYDIPKQFLKANEKEIIIHTLEHFQKNAHIDGIVVACKEEWIEFLKGLIQTYQLTKVLDVVPGGDSGQLSIYQGIQYLYNISTRDDIVLIHDGVRPLIDDALISNNIETAKQHGSCITCVKVTETIVESQDQSMICDVYKREPVYIAKAPQTFRLHDIYEAHQKAMQDGEFNSIDSCTLMKQYEYPLYMLLGDYKNIKITTPIDYFMFKAILENEQ